MPEPHRIGLRLDPHLPDGGEDPGAARDRLAAFVDAAATVEAAGFDALWIAERPTSAAALIPSALVLCAAVAVRTEALRIATGLLPLPLYHPLRIAEDAASIDGLSAGRFELGVGLGSDSEVTARFGVEAEERAERFEESLDVLQQAWAGGPLDHQGRHFTCQGLEVHPRPEQPGGPPLWIGAAAAAPQRRAAARGAGLVLRPGDSPAPYLEAWPAEAGPPRITLLLDEEHDPAATWARRPPTDGAHWDAVLSLPPATPAGALAREIERASDRAGTLRETAR